MKIFGKGKEKNPWEELIKKNQELLNLAKESAR